MKRQFLLATALAGTLAFASTVNAQTREPGIPPGVGAGAATGAVGGAIVGGPVGAAVGGVAGAVVGGIAETSRPRFREYVVTHQHRSYDYDGEVVVGRQLPRQGVTYYRVPSEYGPTEYRYTIINNRTVLVDPETGRIVQVVD
ncbi:MAG: DUF1236 domain-containing protein [Phreatobacter sp.]|uniref:DUF1236 domain-containing protein n=1 Tax=Phreatobacter sp. TaxID=1966341 RepID=UPI001A3C8DE5|nr:DUF1236 domain-containing protein [Phreatobacter sp.]MBL8570137.1 DUF1236 domain-containing protein [Phreatobacter sp.]